MFANQEWTEYTALDIHDNVILGGKSIFNYLVVAPLAAEQADITSFYEMNDTGNHCHSVQTGPHASVLSMGM
jgi:hypothetical protein